MKKKNENKLYQSIDPKSISYKAPKNKNFTTIKNEKENINNQKYNLPSKQLNNQF